MSAIGAKRKLPFPKKAAQFPECAARRTRDRFDFLQLRVRSLSGQPPSVATPPDFRIKKFVPPFPSVGGSIMLTELEMVPICGTLLPIAEASLWSVIFDFRFSFRDLARDTFVHGRDWFGRHLK